MQESNGHRASSRDRDRDRDRERERDRDRTKRKSRSRSKDRKRRSRSKDRHREKGREREREKDRDRRRRSRSREKRRSPRRRSPPRERPRNYEYSPEERDARTVFCMQLSQRIRPRDLEEFFSSVGRVYDVRLIADGRTGRSKGIAYVEFEETSSVNLALGLNGQKLLGVPIIVQVSQAEKNRAAQQAAQIEAETARASQGPMRLYVGSLHFNITEDMLRGIFEPFGKIEHINLVLDPETSRSKGFGFVTFIRSEDAKKAMEQLNGFEIAGRPMKVNHVTEKMDGIGSMIDTDEMDRAGIDLGATGRLQLMAKLAEGTGFQLPKPAASALSVQRILRPQEQHQQALQQAVTTPPIATQCFMLSNMFDTNSDKSGDWETEIKDDVITECNKHGGCVHVYVDKASPQGNVYVKCPSIASAVASVNALHGRWFGGRMVTAAYVPLPNYTQLFPHTHRAMVLLMPSTSKQTAAQAGLMHPAFLK
ncbi:DgyrCDS13504 [Dimorphilus gyrociliatus]|uniref:DgyrCDS13504 n=1 Tax=Dimorphilus gyrociliatus TaxID=2664684 RepID=A0A7I8WAV5_9ANNE|nr:DgyrCDS13504 [Dimorphilus gyrociliatus]